MNAIHSQPVKLNEDEIERLISAYKKAYSEVVREIVTIKDLKIRTRKQKLANITEILKDLKVDVDAFIEKEIEKQYTAGALQAIRELKSQGVEGIEMSAFNRIHREAIKNLVSETQSAFLVGMQGVAKDANVVLGRAVRDQITMRLLEGSISSRVMREVKNNIVNDLKDRGLSALIDKGGKRWSLDNYSQMIIRTKLAESRNRGVANKTAEMGYDLVIVSTHGSKHFECARWEGQILSMTGFNKNYPTLDDATSSGLFHPNCLHAINPFVQELNEDYEPPELKAKVTIESL